MAFKVQVGPPQIAIHRGRTVLVCEPDGSIAYPGDKGLYLNDTRLISSWSLSADGIAWDLLSGGPVDHDASRIHLTNRRLPTSSGVIEARTLGLFLSRFIAEGLHEDIDVVNHSGQPVAFNLEISLRCDFADVFETKSGETKRRGSIATTWSEDTRQLETVYTNDDFRRSVKVRARSREPMGFANGRLSFAVSIEPGHSWHCCVLYDLGDGVRIFDAPAGCEHERPATSADTAAWKADVLKIRTSNEEFYRTFHQAIDDMAALQLPQGTGESVSFVPAAGLPWFTALFGRDSLIASLQSMVIDPNFANATLDVLGRYQATERDDYRDAEPGKILHELRFGELAHFKLIPHTPYYGTADATPLYLITLHETWRWSGDAGLLDRHINTVEGCLRWIDEWGDRDGDGCRNTRPGLRSATRTPPGRTRATACPTSMERWCADRRPCASFKAMSTMPGVAWPRCSRRRANRTAPRPCAPKPRRSTTGSTPSSGTRPAASTPIASMATSSRSSQWRPMSATASGPASWPPIALVAWSTV